MLLFPMLLEFQKLPKAFKILAALMVNPDKGMLTLL